MRLATLTTSILAGCLFVGDLADFSPNAQRFHKLYGEPTIEFFSVRKGIMMAVEYGPDREACELLIGPTQSLIQRGNQEPISSPAVSDLLQEWVPVATTGKQISENSVQIGGTILLKTNYETVSITRECLSKSCPSSKDNQDRTTLVIFKRDTCPKRIE